MGGQTLILVNVIGRAFWLAVTRGFYAMAPLMAIMRA